MMLTIGYLCSVDETGHIANRRVFAELFQPCYNALLFISKCLPSSLTSSVMGMEMAMAMEMGRLHRIIVSNRKLLKRCCAQLTRRPVPLENVRNEILALFERIHSAENIWYGGWEWRWRWGWFSSATYGSVLVWVDTRIYIAHCHSPAASS